MRRRWRRPFDVDLAVTKVLKGANVAAATHTFHVAVPGNPFGGCAVHTDPPRQVLAVKQDRRVRGWLAGLFLGAGGGGGYYRGLCTGPLVVQIVRIGLCLDQRSAHQPKDRQGREE